MVFWLWFVVLPARLSVLCPEECRCNPEGFEFHCSGTSLNPVPSIHHTSIRILRLSYNEIKLLEKDSFVLLTELEQLYIYNFGLRTIELGAFNGLTTLTELSIWSNEISEISPGTFENINSLEYLGLHNNRLKHLDSGVFSGLVNLKHVTLNGNQLQYLHPDTFLGLPNLQRLYLDKNWALQIPTDGNFINSHSLLSLGISYCNVSLVSIETFAKVSALEWLDLRYNNLRTVDINVMGMLPKLSALLLYGNPLQCDCQLQEVWRWCNDRYILTEYKDRTAECDTPKEMKGMWWGVLGKGQCLEGNT